MGKRIRRTEDSAEVNMTPMLDIVFILLIFFIVTATFLNEQGLQMITPPNNDDTPPSRPLPSILVQIDENNTIFIRSKAQLRRVDIARVTANIQREIVENGGRAVVTIQPHEDSEHGVVTSVYDSAVQAEAAGVAVRKPQSS